MSNSKRLLFVDDEDSIRATLPLILQEHGFDVKSAASVAEALQKIQTHSFDIVLSDLNIHKPQDGFDVVRAMRKVNPRSVAIILTGYPAVENAVEALRLRIDDYFVKPADVNSLVATMNEKLAERKQA
jgi:DNA-binding NtrC family response regulator